MKHYVIKRLFEMIRTNFLLFLILLPLTLFGQLTPVTNQYVLNPLTINPAFAGNRGSLNIAAFYRKQWVGLSGAPETLTFATDAAFFDKKVGLGFIIVTDKVGVTRENQILSNYSYKIRIGDGNLSFGLGVGLITSNTAWSDLIVLDPGDELYLVDSRLFVVPSISFGTYYSYHNYFAGFSIPKFLSYKFNYNKNKYSISVDPGQYSYMLSTGYLFDVAEKIKVLPSTLIIYTPGQNVLFDLNVHVNFLDRFWIGGSYRNSRSVAGLFQFQINPQFKIAYTYDFDLDQLRTYSNGSHEIMLRYEFKYKVNVANPLIF
jgi:type IX secretion system PorP/SprF family membrane protein